jgi:hypothetical protein
MDKQAIINKFIEKGILISPDMLEKVSEKNIDAFLEKKTMVVSEDRKPEVDVRKIPGKKKLTPVDFTGFYLNKYNSIKNILNQKIDAVSINNTKPGNVAIIGMVRSATPQGFVVEDQSGSMEVVTDKQPGTDDVIGLKGIVREGKLFGGEVIYPDVPLPKEIPNADMSIVLSEAPTSEDGDFVISMNDLPNPGWLTLSKAGKRFMLLAYRPKDDATPKDAVEWIKKRYLPHNRESIQGEENPFVMDPQPDILWLKGKAAESHTYKGITIISTGEKTAKINLSTRDVEFK